MKRLLYALSNNRLRFVQVLLFGVGVNAAFAAADPLVMKLMVDEGIIKKNFALFAGSAALVVLLGVGMRGILLANELFAQKLKNSVTESLTLRMVKSYFDIPYSEINRADSGYFISRIYDEPAKVAQGIVTTFIGLVTGLITLATGFTVSLYLAWRITLLLSLVVPALYYLAHRFNPKIKAASERENEEEARFRDVLGRSVNSYKTVKVFGLFASVHGFVLRQLQSYLDVFYQRAKTSQNYQALSNMWLSFAEGLVLVAAGWEVVAGNLSIGGLFAFMSAFWKVVSAVTGVVSQVPELSRISGCIDRLAEFEGLAGSVESSDTNSKSIVLENVSFGYNARKLLNEFNLTVGADERILIVGPNGCGKTTLGHLVTGFLEPAGGFIQRPGLHRISAMLSPFHFAPGNLKDNVNYNELSGERAKLFWELVRGLRLESRVECDASSELSEGEKKKCQIVMTLLKDADVYVFDEPLANIDVESRDVVMRTKFEHTRGKTMISIMHGDEKYRDLFDRVIALN